MQTSVTNLFGSEVENSYCPKCIISEQCDFRSAV